MKHNKVYLFATATIAAAMLLTACGADQAAETTTAPKEEAKTTQAATVTTQEATAKELASAVKELVTELKKTDAPVDFAKAIKLYDEKIKASVQARDTEYKDTVNDQITTSLKGGQEGKLKPEVVAQLADKLLQKVAFLTTRHEFAQANENFKDQAKAKADVQEAKDVYDALLKGMIEKRDKAYSTQLVTGIDAGFTEMTKAIEKGDNLAYQLGKQVVDKSIMKAFYLAAGAEQGYAFKVEKAAKEGKEGKVEQAEGWAFYQSLKGYFVRFDKDAADFIEKQFDLSTDVKTISGEKINLAFVRAIAATAAAEYKESFANWGKDKAAITSLEGALFLGMIQNDLTKHLGEAEAKAVLELAQAQLDATKAGNKEKATELFDKIKVSLDKLQAVGK